MTAIDVQQIMFKAQRTALAFSLIFLPGTILHWLTNYPLFEAISVTTIWLIPGLSYIYFNCRTLPAIHRLLVFLLPFGRMHSPGLVVFCWLWPISIPLLRRFNRRRDSASQQ